MPAEAQRREPEQRTGEQRHYAAGDETQPVTDLIVRRADADGVSAEAEKRRLRKIDLAAQAEHDGQPEYGDRESRRLHQDVEYVAVEAHRRSEGHDDCNTDKVWRVADQQRPRTRRRDDGRDIVRGGAHAFSATRSPKMPCGRKMRNMTSTRKAKASLYGTDT